MYSQAEYSVFSPRIHCNQLVDTTKSNITMKLTFVLRNKQNALKLSTKTLDSFIERIKTDTKDGAVARRRHESYHFGRMLSGIPNLKKRETRYGSEYFVRCKKA